MGKEIEHEHTEEVVCPHCGYKHEEYWEFENGDYDCAECGKWFTVSRNVSVTFTTRSRRKGDG